MFERNLRIRPTSNAAGLLPTLLPEPTQTEALIGLLALDLEDYGRVAGGLRSAQCCKPDGGTCCPNKR